MTTHEVDVVVVGAGTAGCYAAATVADAGYDVVVAERKDREEAGHIACGDALKGASNFPDAIPRSQIRPAFTNTDVDHGRFEIPQLDTAVDIPVPGELAVIDRWEYGRCLIEGATEAGAEMHYDTVVKDVRQNGQVQGLDAVREGDPVEYDADVVIDAAGALSILQDKADFSTATFDTNVTYSQFCSAYREIVTVDEPVEWSDALVFKPTDRAAGYLWYFPRTETEINVGLGFQMTEEPMQLIEDLREDLQTREEFEGATVDDKLGAALPTRRPYDSAVAPGFMSAGDAAGHVNPTNGEGISGAAKAGNWAGSVAADAVGEGDVSEAALWGYNRAVQASFGRGHAALDLYNILGTAHETAEITALIDGLPGQQLFDIITDRGRFSPKLRELVSLGAKTLVGTRGNWGLLYEAYKVNTLADEIKSVYRDFPTSPDGFEAWCDRRDDVLEQVYDITGADPKY